MRAAGGREFRYIPCLNEEATIAKVVGDFHRELPEAAIYVIDNASTDTTAARAKAAGAVVIREPRRGKGFAIRAAFRDVDADVYVLADGDDQTPSARVHELVAPIADGRADMVVGSRALMGRTSEKCWVTMPIPAAIASFGERIVTGRPSTSTVPASADVRP